MNKLNIAYERFNRYAEQNRAAIADFAKRLVDNPAIAMQWADSQFVNAAKVEIYGGLANELSRSDVAQQDEVLKGLHRWAMGRVLGAARTSVNQSTSQSSNILDRAIAQVWAEVAEYLEDLISL